jgi:hypothetical protein
MELRSFAALGVVHAALSSASGREKERCGHDFWGSFSWPGTPLFDADNKYPALHRGNACMLLLIHSLTHQLMRTLWVFVTAPQTLLRSSSIKNWSLWSTSLGPVWYSLHELL